VRPLTKEHLAEAAVAFAAASGQTSATTAQRGQDNITNGVAATTPLPATSPLLEGAAGAGAGVEKAAAATTPAQARKVMLAPFGIAAILTGNSYKASDPMAEKILEDWASFFPLCNKDNTDVPPVVEVVSGKSFNKWNRKLLTWVLI